MNTRDPLPDWCEPGAIQTWGKECSPPLAPAWMDYLNCYVHPDIVMVVRRMLLPIFIEHDGGVFLKNGFTVEVYTDWKAHLGDLAAVEEMLNHRHVYDLFAATDEIPEASYDGVARLMGQCWDLALRTCYPDRRFAIRVSNTEEDYGPVVTFWSA